MLLSREKAEGLLQIIDDRYQLDVHCKDGEKQGKVSYPLKQNMRLTNTCALVIRDFPDGLEIIDE